jgi:hypothetical protein
MISIKVQRFDANNPNLLITDIIGDVRVAKNDAGIINVRFNTEEKYYSVVAEGTLYDHGKNYECIVIRPEIDIDGTIMPDIGLDSYKFQGLFDKYIEHPKCFRLELGVDTTEFPDELFKTIITPLKYEYAISIIPYELLLGGENMQSVELINDKKFN